MKGGEAGDKKDGTIKAWTSSLKAKSRWTLRTHQCLCIFHAPANETGTDGI